MLPTTIERYPKDHGRNLHDIKTGDDPGIITVMRRAGQHLTILLPDSSRLVIRISEVREEEGHFWACLMVASDKHNISPAYSTDHADNDRISAVIEVVEPTNPPAPPAPETVEE